MRATPVRYQNHLICELTEEARQALGSHLKPAPLRAGEVLQAQGEDKRSAYFIESGVVSLARLMADGSRVEASLVGREGMVGSGVNGLPAFTEAEVQAPGMALCIESELLQLLAARHASLRDVLARYNEYLLDEARMNAVCNATHAVDQRLAKWLLRCLDRVDGDSLEVTQEFVADVLGVQRTSITASLQRLAGRGLVATTRGRVSILNAEGLKALSCECYEHIAERLPDVGLREASDRGECAA